MSGGVDGWVDRAGADLGTPDGLTAVDVTIGMTDVGGRAARPGSAGGWSGSPGPIARPLVGLVLRPPGGRRALPAGDLGGPGRTSRGGSSRAAGRRGDGAARPAGAGRRRRAAAADGPDRGRTPLRGPRRPGRLGRPRRGGRAAWTSTPSSAAWTWTASSGSGSTWTGSWRRSTSTRSRRGSTSTP